MAGGDYSQDDIMEVLANLLMKKQLEAKQRALTKEAQQLEKEKENKLVGEDHSEEKDLGDELSFTESESKAVSNYKDEYKEDVAKQIETFEQEFNTDEEIQAFTLDLNKEYQNEKTKLNQDPSLDTKPKEEAFEKKIIAEMAMREMKISPLEKEEPLTKIQEDFSKNNQESIAAKQEQYKAMTSYEINKDIANLKINLDNTENNTNDWNEAQTDYRIAVLADKQLSNELESLPKEDIEQIYQDEPISNVKADYVEKLQDNYYQQLTEGNSSDKAIMDELHILRDGGLSNDDIENIRHTALNASVRKVHDTKEITEEDKLRLNEERLRLTSSIESDKVHVTPNEVTMNDKSQLVTPEQTQEEPNIKDLDIQHIDRKLNEIKLEQKELQEKQEKVEKFLNQDLSKSIVKQISMNKQMLDSTDPAIKALATSQINNLSNDLSKVKNFTTSGKNENQKLNKKVGHLENRLNGVKDRTSTMQQEDKEEKIETLDEKEETTQTKAPKKQASRSR